MSKKTAFGLILKTGKFAGAISVIVLGLFFAQAVTTVFAQPATVITVVLLMNDQEGIPSPVFVNEGGSVNIRWTVTPTDLSPINCIASGFFSGTPWSGWSGLKSYPTGSETLSVPVGSISGSLRLACSISATEGGFDEVFFKVVPPDTTVELFANDTRPTLTIPAPGNVTLRWTTTNSPILCQASWGAAGHLVDVAGGTEDVSVSSTTTYTVTCQREGSPNSSSSVTVQIGSTPPPPPAVGFSRLEFCISYGDIVAIIGFPSSPIPPAQVNMLQIGDGGPGASFLTVDRWPSNLVKVVSGPAGGFVLGHTYYFKGYLVFPTGLNLITPWATLTADASIPPCVGAPPTPPPPPPPVTLDCSEPEITTQYTKVSIEPLPEHIMTVSVSNVAAGSTVDLGLSPELSPPFVVNEDLSKLPAPFVANSSNYLESPVGEQVHRDQDIMALNSQDFNEYNRAVQKAAPIYMTDDLRMTYVDYVNNKPTLKEAPNTYADYNGANPKTVAQMVADYELPNPPSHGGDQDTWVTTWGMYWSKIPTAVNEYYAGFVDYGFAVGNATWERLIDPTAEDRSCAYPRRQFWFNMPTYFRGASVANQINQLMVPKAAQSSRSDFAKNPVTDSNENVQAERKDQKENDFISIVKKLLKISFEIVQPLKNVYAQEEDGGGSSCPIPIPVLPNDKQGGGPFCHLLQKIPDRDPTRPPTPNLRTEDGETCSDGVHCRLLVKFLSLGDGVLTVPNSSGAGGSTRWDSCSPSSVDLVTGEILSFNCSTTIRLYRVYYFPWLAPIWNNTTYSDEADSIAIVGTGLTGPTTYDSVTGLRTGGQETGRPGDYGPFIPKGVEDTIFSHGKNLPAADSTAGALELIKQRFLGAVDCAKEFSRDKSLKPLALQEGIMYSPECGL